MMSDLTPLPARPFAPGIYPVIALDGVPFPSVNRRVLSSIDLLCRRRGRKSHRVQLSPNSHGRQERPVSGQTLGGLLPGGLPPPWRAQRSIRDRRGGRDIHIHPSRQEQWQRPAVLPRRVGVLQQCLSGHGRFCGCRLFDHRSGLLSRGKTLSPTLGRDERPRSGPEIRTDMRTINHRIRSGNTAKIVTIAQIRTLTMKPGRRSTLNLRMA